MRHEPPHAPGHERERGALEDQLARDHVRIDPHQRRRDRDARRQFDQVEGHRGAVALAKHDPASECEAGAEQHAHNRGVEPVEDHVDGVRRQGNGGRERENAADGVAKPRRGSAARLESRERERRQGDRRAEADAVRNDRLGGVAVVAQPTSDREPGWLDRAAAEHQHQKAAFAQEGVAEGIAFAEESPVFHRTLLPRNPPAGTLQGTSAARRHYRSPRSWSSI